MIRVQVRFFAGQRDIVGQPDITLAVEPGTTIGGLWEHLVQEYPRLAGYTGRLLYALNQQYSDLSAPLSDGDEVAFIPPVSGGADSGAGTSPEKPEEADALPAPFAISEHPLDPAPLARLVQTSSDGAVVTFAGVVRNNFEGRATACLTYEAYAEMALPVLAQIAAEAQGHWDIGRVAVHHRVGRLAIGETAVLVVVAAPHRQAAFAAAAYVMDRIKQIAPIWKREHWADGAAEWHEPPTPSST
jgi:molybdopterin synthase catalytic subunit